jgi:hypothetical protein
MPKARSHEPRPDLERVAPVRVEPAGCLASMVSLSVAEVAAADAAAAAAAAGVTVIALS